MNRNDSKTRLYIIAAFQILIILAILIRYFVLMVFEDPETQYAKTVNSRRGDIYDSRGVVLVQHKQYFDLEIIPDYISDKELVYDFFIKNPITDNARLRKILFSESMKTYTIEKKIEYDAQKKIKEFIEKNKITGIYLREFYGRIYPQNNLVSHITGFVNYENKGQKGLERRFNNELQIKNKNIGYSIFTTIDLNIQYFAEQAAKAAVEEHNPDNIMILIMEAKTGRILAWSAKPSYNPNNLNDSTPQDRINYPATYLYEPGSVFKIFSLSSALELGKITPDDTFLNPGYFIIPGTVNERLGGLASHGEMSLTDVIRESSNVGTALAVKEISDKNLYSRLRDFGFGSKTGIDLDYEEDGLFKRPSKWSLRSKYSISIGQEISTTAIQIVSAATAFANDGIRLKPLIVDRIESPNGELIKEFKPEQVKAVISPNVATTMLEMMYSAAESGTARRSKVSGIRLSSKTGTAQIFDVQQNKYSDDKFFASCLTLLPTDNPELIMYVGITNPRGKSIYGGRIAAPVIHKLAEELIPYLGIKKSTDKVISHTGNIEYTDATIKELGSTLPDFTGLSKREILPLFNIKGINVKISGEGWVVEQNPAPGTEVKEGMTIELRLNGNH